MRVYRGGQIESTHYGSIAVVDSSGRLVAYAGDPHSSTFLRSAAKPFQTLPILQEGAGQEYQLTSEEIALMCGSHGGEPRHISTVAAILRKGEFDESDLLCGTHIPYDERVAAEMRLSGEAPSVLHNNCSGKHAGMLLGCALMDAPTATYLNLDHPLEQRILQCLAEFAGVQPESIPTGVDGCGVASFYLSLYRAAYAYARLAATAAGTAAPAGLPRYADAARELTESMMSCPEYVAGAWSITTPLMQSYGSQLLAKEGAEGFYAMTIFPELTSKLTDRLSLSGDGPIGVAMKVSDGSMTRGRDPAILRTLNILGIETEGLDKLSPFGQGRIQNYSGTLVGEVKAEFDLTFL